MTNEALALQIRQGRTDLFDALWEQNTGFIYTQANKAFNKHFERCHCCGVELDDLLQTGFFALRDAVQTYDENKEPNLLAYFKYAFRKRFCALIGLRTTKRNPLDESASLNEMLDGDAEAQPLYLLADPDSEQMFASVFDDVFRSELYAALAEAMDKLPVNSAAAIRGRWLEGKKQKQVAAEMGLVQHKV
ncbi:MAG: sigma-70 family RNA polymerase sigma factor [Firmicutes bacterium]|nr:sigma-70 family RNA polymerase sigma factor [Bacillota bacterium]